ncbi:hypothetical protein SDC9_190422 [bioreactor metagenome]|uniref:Uncharacterized protein n=1 Tax=bioreactor metagenome TaxID=1076179 RepID=A0A645I385_9ZZZZ
MSVGNKRYLGGSDLSDQGDEFRSWITFNIEFCIYFCLQIEYIGITHMSLIGARMNRDTISPEKLAVSNYLHQIGNIPATCIPQSSYFVYINTKLSHKFLQTICHTIIFRQNFAIFVNQIQK